MVLIRPRLPFRITPALFGIKIPQRDAYLLSHDLKFHVGLTSSVPLFSHVAPNDIRLL